ncbi:DUF6542 domain-containing protein [Allokutzneria sp. NRRL B-24872]|uniref:DUF6542 domain-containing protein n=1 Tax=Allokutzneria sp. NRRL B-24872 TaxID=1137961 RepID=UPI00117811A5|nr:DUF6542 domain-containing protein [Allokutzneria sp. NRRL B-24872]
MSTDGSTGQPRVRRRGLPWWAVALAGIAVTGAGMAFGETYFPFALAGGCVVAALLADRSALFTAAVQPPLIALAVLGAAALFSGSLLRSASVFASVFPILAATTGCVVLIVLVRLLLNRRKAASDAQ